jgi:hypothetical protein
MMKLTLAALNCALFAQAIRMKMAQDDANHQQECEEMEIPQDCMEMVSPYVEGLDYCTVYESCGEC